MVSVELPRPPQGQGPDKEKASKKLGPRCAMPGFPKEPGAQGHWAAIVGAAAAVRELSCDVSESQNEKAKIEPKRKSQDRTKALAGFKS